MTIRHGWELLTKAVARVEAAQPTTSEYDSAVLYNQKKKSNSFRSSVSTLFATQNAFTLGTNEVLAWDETSRGRQESKIKN